MSGRRIVLRQADYTVLHGLVKSWKQTDRMRLPHVARLSTELQSALVVDENSIPHDAITMYSRVRYRHLDRREAAAATETAVIVFPAQASQAPENVSILSPLGMALIGERVGTEIEYEAPGGTYRIAIESVEHAVTGRSETREQ
ncbi:MAG: hypothetical protein EA384_08630 [Spirochaetaceae bacterium]|nr:MAG: hypothetical protein EA384_08630 [Spirochaetaceae bacterium]